MNTMCNKFHVVRSFVEIILELIEHFFSEIICQDLPGFRLIVDKWTGQTEPCSWIDDAFSFEDVEVRRNTFCPKPHVRQACRRACGECCGDNKDHRFFFETEEGKTRKASCSWLAEGDEKRRKKHCELKKGSCPKTCNECDAELPIAISPTCKDDPFFRINNSGRSETCSWLTSGFGYRDVVSKRREFCNDSAVLGACPLSCGECVATPSTCEDDPDYILPINPGGRTVGCSWLDDAFNFNDVNFRRKEQCKKPAIQNNCHRACGFCCGNNDNHRFVDKDEKGENVEVTCDILGKDQTLNDRYCGMKLATCPESCGVCENEPTPTPPTPTPTPPTPTPTPPTPTPPTTTEEEPCEDKESFQFTINTETGKQKPCTFIDILSSIEGVNQRRQRFCKRNQVKEKCKRACGTCCGDNESYMFQHFVDGNATAVTCEWLSKKENRKNRYCGEHSTNCPKACGVCGNPKPTFSPTTPAPKPPKYQKCRDNPSFTFSINENSNKTRFCSWIDGADTIDDIENRRKRVCKRKKVSDNCQRACGECCGNNKEYVFEHKVVEKQVDVVYNITCDWLTGNEEMKLKYCDMKKLSCPDACGECKPEPKPEEILKCEDNKRFRFVLNSEQGNKAKPCSWIDSADTIEGIEDRRKKVCSRKNVRNKCPRACGVEGCCGDNEKFVFEHEESGFVYAATCEWLAGKEDRKKKYCDTLNLTCPEACEICTPNDEEDNSLPLVAGMGSSSEASQVKFSFMQLLGASFLGVFITFAL